MKKENWIQVWSYLKPTHIPVSQAIQDHEWLCSAEKSILLSYSLLRCCWAMQLLGILASLFDLAVLGATFRSEAGCDSALMPGRGNARLQSKKPLWRPASGRTIPCSDCTTILLHRWAKPLVGTATWVLQVGTQSVKIQVRVSGSLSLLLHHHQIPGGQALQISSPSLVGWVWNGGS